MTSSLLLHSYEPSALRTSVFSPASWRASQYLPGRSSHPHNTQPPLSRYLDQLSSQRSRYEPLRSSHNQVIYYFERPCLLARLVYPAARIWELPRSIGVDWPRIRRSYGSSYRRTKASSPKTSRSWRTHTLGNTLVQKSNCGNPTRSKERLLGGQGDQT